MVDVAAGAPLTVTGSGAEMLIDPEVPVMVAVAAAGTADWPAVRLSVAIPLVGLGEMVAVTPLGKPDMARFTLPLNPFRGTTEIVDFSDAPGSRYIAPGAATSVKVDALTVRGIVVVAVRLPDVPEIVTVAGPEVAAALAASVSMVLPVAGFGVKDAVTPLGRPDATKVTPPLKPY
jgi:hypothetical protein